jgi:hypothetical protein
MAKTVKIAKIEKSEWKSLNNVLSMQVLLEDEGFNFKRDELNHFLVFLKDEWGHDKSLIYHPNGIIGSSMNKFRNTNQRNENLDHMVKIHEDLPSRQKMYFSPDFGAITDETNYNLVKKAYASNGFNVEELEKI